MAIPGDRRTLIQRHRWKLLISLFGFTAVCATGSIIIFLIKRWLYRQQLRISEDHFMREQMRRRFVQTQEDSLRTLGQLLPVFSIILNNDDLNIDDLFKDLKNKKNGNEEENDKQKSKAELWNELKINSIVKIVTITYTISTFILLTRLQLNMLARREYLETTVTMNVEKKKDTNKQYYITTLFNKFWNYNSVESTIAIDNNDKLSSIGIKQNKITYINEQAYLSLSWWLLNRGYHTFKTEAYKYVTEEFSIINPRDQLTIPQFNDHLSKIFQSINRDILLHKEDRIKMTEIMLPDETELFNVLQETLNLEEIQLLKEDDTVLKRLMLEATQCIESTASNIVLENLINMSYQYVMNNIETKIIAKSQKKQTQSETDIQDTPYQMAMYSIIIKDTCQEILPQNSTLGTTNPFLETLDKLEVLDELSSSVYSNFNI